MKTTNQIIALTALFVALAVAMGYAFMLVPNVEMISATVFIAGLVLGPWRGALAGFFAELIYSMTNAWGAALPPLLAAQVISFALIGLVGGLVATFSSNSVLARALLYGLCGLLLTLFYNISTTLSFAVYSYGLNLKKIISIFVAGSVFTLVHILGNTIIFATVVPAVQSALQRRIKWQK